MITSIRRQCTGVAYKSIIWFIIFAFVAGLAIIPGALRYARTGGPWVIRVNGEDISYQDYTQEVQDKQRWLAGINAQYGEYATLLLRSMGIDPNPRTLAFDQLVRNELITQFADRLDLFVHPDYIASQLHNPYVVLRELSGLIPAQVVNFQTGSIDASLLKQYLQHKGMSINQFEWKLARLFNNKIAMDIVGSTFYVPEFQQKQALAQATAAKAYTVLTVPIESVIQRIKQMQPTDEQLQLFYDQQNQLQKRYWTPEKRSGLVWRFDAQSYQIAISEDEVSGYYDANKAKQYIEKPATIQVRRILVPITNDMPREQALTKMELIQQEIARDPARFAQLAQEHALDNRGGLMEPFARGQGDQARERAAFLLAQDGDISSIIQTKDGLEIIQRVKKEAPTYKSLQAVKAEIRQILLKKKFKELFAQDIKRITELPAAQRMAALQALVKQKNGKAETVKEAVLTDSPESRGLFKLEQEGITSLVNEDGGVVVKLTGIQRAFLPALTEIKQTVQEDWYRQRAEDELKRGIDEGRAKLVKGVAFAEVQKELGGKIEQVGPIKASEKHLVEDLDKRGLPVQRMLQLEKEGATVAEITPSHGYLIRLVRMEPEEMSKGDSVKQKESELASEQQRLFVEAFIASLYRNATIETSDAVLI